MSGCHCASRTRGSEADAALRGPPLAALSEGLSHRGQDVSHGSDCPMPIRSDCVCVQSYCDYHRSMSVKHRLTVTVDPELVAAGNRAVASGSAPSLSAWVSAALAEQARRDRKLEELHAAVADYEAEFGEITGEEIAAQRRKDREDAAVVRGRRSSAPRSASRTKTTRSS
jgi:hypothetical protein